MAEQFFFVISGVATIEVDGTVNTLRPMQGIHIKLGIAHQLENQGDVDLEFIVTSTPPSHDDRLLAPAFNSRPDTQN